MHRVVSLERIKEADLGSTTHSRLTKVAANELGVLENNPPVIRAHVLAWAFVVLFLHNSVHVDVTVTVRPKENIDDLLACP